MDQQNVVLLDEFVEGGLLDDADVRVTRSRWEVWDYKGKAPATFALGLNLTDSEGKVHEEHLSCGELTRFQPSGDGRFAVPVGSQVKLNSNTNAVAFILSLMQADLRGELAGKLKSTGDVSVLEGAMLHVSREAQPKRTGLLNPVGANGQEQGKTRIKVDKVIGYPGENVASAPKTATATSTPGAAPTPAAPAGNSDDDNFAIGVILSLLSNNGGSIKTGAIAGKAFTDPAMQGATPAQRNATLGKLVQPAFLGAPGRPWAYDAAAGTISFQQ